jgi:hypothetical protein
MWQFIKGVGLFVFVFGSWFVIWVISLFAR